LSTPRYGVDHGWTIARATVLMVLGVFALAVVGWGAELGHRPRTLAAAPTAAAAGDCATLHRLVACGDPAAQYEVLQVFPGTGDRTRCAEVPGSEFAWVQPVGAHGPVAVVCVTRLLVPGRGAEE
jgi:hypothetical protein